MEKPKLHYELAPQTKKLGDQIRSLIEDFVQQIETLETKLGMPLVVFQDGKNDSFYIDSHILSTSVSDLFDFDASLDPDEQEDIKANRTLQSLNKLYDKMKADAVKGRQFNDIIVEYMPSGSRAERPLKIYGGQHRASSIELAAKSDVFRYHGFRIYFGLTIDQRSEIAQISNSNINVPLDLFDKMQETVLGPELRNWCKSVGLLSKDFAENKNNEGIITARLARTLVVNFIQGTLTTGGIQERAYSSLIGAEVNQEYLTWSKEKRKQILENVALIEAGKEFAKLHKSQMDAIKKDDELSKVAEFKTKALTPAVLSTWSFVAGMLQKDKARLKKLYQLPDKTKGKNPLAAKEMSQYKHQSDLLKPYRGLATRTDKKERGKMIELFLLYSKIQQAFITTPLIDSAVTNYFSYVLQEERKKKAAKIK
jgi:hypothetical protein